MLTRGYAIVNNEDGSILRSVTQTATGREVQITLSDGKISATVTNVKEETK